MAQQVSDAEFEQQILKSSEPVLVDFWAEWCGPCRQLSPIIDEISNELKNIKVAKINIDNNPESPTKYGVRGIPTLMIFKDGQVVGTKVGALPKSKLVEWINETVVA